ncbi:MAG: F0F1 ATP synthase subunit gamma [Nitrospiria bacterium]
MSKRARLDRHLHLLGDIKNIMNAMKHLSLMETQKLTKNIATLRSVVQSIESAIADFLSFFPSVLEGGTSKYELYLLLGSERGFCGNFNESLIASLNSYTGDHPEEEYSVILVGSRLSAKLKDDSRVTVRLNGPGTAEEIETVLLKLMHSITDALNQDTIREPLRLTVFSHNPDTQRINRIILQPFKETLPKALHFADPPLLNEDASTFVTQLADHYLFAVLNELFSSSLLAENLSRLQHMENAIHYLDQEGNQLQIKRNRLWQEEITEEIEVILLSDIKRDPDIY